MTTLVFLTLYRVQKCDFSSLSRVSQLAAGETKSVDTATQSQSSKQSAQSLKYRGGARTNLFFKASPLINVRPIPDNLSSQQAKEQCHSWCPVNGWAAMVDRTHFLLNLNDRTFPTVV